MPRFTRGWRATTRVKQPKTSSSVKLSLRVHVSKQFHTDFLLTREFTAGGHSIGFTTGQQKHVTLSRTPYLEAYVEALSLSYSFP